MDEYTRSSWYLKGLPRAICTKVMRKHGVNPNDATTLKFEPLYETVMKMSENEIAMRAMDINSDQAAQKAADRNMSSLVDMVKKK